MPADTSVAFALAVELHQELQRQSEDHPHLKDALRLSDELAREMGWIWACRDI